MMGPRLRREVVEVRLEGRWAEECDRDWVVEALHPDILLGYLFLFLYPPVGTALFIQNALLVGLTWDRLEGILVVVGILSVVVLSPGLEPALELRDILQVLLLPHRVRLPQLDELVLI